VRDPHPANRAQLSHLGIRKVIIASSITAYGACFAEGDRDYTSFPVDEDYDADPTDSYGLSRLVGEKIARSSLPAPAPKSTRFGLASSSSRLTMSDFRRV
jgi:nucleoside-diphosphate-sugar epimerase